MEELELTNQTSKHSGVRVDRANQCSKGEDPRFGEYALDEEKQSNFDRRAAAGCKNLIDKKTLRRSLESVDEHFTPKSI